jgi:hypothetical protein
MDDVVERPAIGVLGRPERPVGGIAEGDHVRGVSVARQHQDAADGVLIAHGRVTGADAEIGGCSIIANRRLSEVVLVDEPIALGLGLSEHEDDRGCRAGDVPGTLPDVPSFPSCWRSVTTTKSHC